MEIDPVAARLGGSTVRHPRLNGYSYGGHDVDVLITGVGMVAAAAWCSRMLTQAFSGTSVVASDPSTSSGSPRAESRGDFSRTVSQYDLALNIGLCGSFDGSLEPGTVVHVVSDRIAELGAEDGDAFLTITQMDLAAEYEFVNSAPPDNAALRDLPAVSGITVNTVHGRESSIAAVTGRFKPQVESMEGAAFMYACLIHDVAFAQVRAVSNVVESRNRGAWKMREAISRLGNIALSILDHA